MRERWVWDRDAQMLVRVGDNAAAMDRPRGPQIVRDFADYVWNPADGNHYGTRWRYEGATRRAGGVEIGHAEHARQQERNADRLRGERSYGDGPRDVIPDIRRAMAQHGWD